MDVRQSEVTSCVLVGEFRVINSHDVQHRCMQVMHMDSIFASVVAEFVRVAIGEPASHTAAGEHDAKSLRVVIASVATLDDGSSSEFPAPNDQRVVPKSSLF